MSFKQMRMFACLVGILFAVLLFVQGATTEGYEGRILVVYDNVQGDAASGLETGGGFAAWLECGGRVVLFDTGGDEKTLAANLDRLQLKKSAIAAVVISHDHWDHADGMPLLAGLAADVYIPSKADRRVVGRVPGLSLIPVEGPRQLLPGVWTTGQLDGEFRGAPIVEQALVVEGTDGLRVVTGCAHVGIVRIVRAAKAMFPQRKIKLVAGGFHLRDLPEDQVKAISDALRELGVEKVGPTHCTGDTAIALFRKEWSNGYMVFHLGDRCSF